MTEDQNTTPQGDNSNVPVEAPVCLHCFTPFDPFRQHFCLNCHATVGQLTPYIPYLNIPFRVSIFAIMWQRVWFDKGTRLLTKLFFLFLILYMAPVMFLGLPFVIREIIRKNRD